MQGRTRTLDDHIELTQSEHGVRPRIAGHRISVRDIVIWHERMGKSADEICAEDDLTLADVYAALAYYFDHRDEIDQSLEEREAIASSDRANLDQAAFRINLKTSRKTSGFFSAINNSDCAAPEGLRLPCSQSCRVRADTPSNCANSAWVRPEHSRARTTG